MKPNSDLSLLDVLSNGLAGVFILMLILSISIGNRGVLAKAVVDEEGNDIAQLERVLKDIKEAPKNQPPLVSIYLTVWGGDMEFKIDAPSATADSILLMRACYPGTQHNWLILRNGPVGSDWSVIANVIHPPDSITVTVFEGARPMTDWTCLPDLKAGKSVVLIDCMEGENNFLPKPINWPCQK